MINSIRLKNILSYKDLTLKFHKGVNMIIGKSDKGKSAVIDGMMWPISHRPLGDDLRSWWEGIMEAELFMDEGTILLRRDKQNHYIINDDEENPLKGFGRAVPEDVAQILNLDIKINIQRQLEKEAPIFLISESPGEVAKFFNRVVGIDIIDTTLSAGKKDINADTAKIKYQKGEIARKQEELDMYKGLDNLCDQVYTAEHKSAAIEKIRDKKTAINTQIDQIDQIMEKSIQILEKQLQILNRVEKASKINSERKEDKRKIKKLKLLISNIDETKEWIENSLEIIGHKALLGQIKNTQIGMGSVQKIIGKIEILLKSIEWEKQEGLKTKKEKEKLERQFKKLMPEVCPFCGK